MKAEFVPFDLSRVALIRRVLSVAETDEPEWDPASVFIYSDGNQGRKQCTLSIGFTADGGNLLKVLERYVDQKGVFAVQMAPYIMALRNGDPGIEPNFVGLLKTAGREDPLFSQVQKDAFDDIYLGPAFQWAKEHGLALPLSFLVVADSFLHSGSVLMSIRNLFTEKTPSFGGDEKTWVLKYTEERRHWLAVNYRKILHSTVYRCDCFIREIARDNWSLAIEPITMNGVHVSTA
jgi:chitosanase